MSRRPVGGYNVFASTGARSDLDAIQNGIQFRVAIHAQTSEFLDQRTKGLPCRGTIPSAPFRRASTSPFINDSHTQRRIAGAVPLPLTSNASHTQLTNSSFAELLKLQRRKISRLVVAGFVRTVALRNTKRLFIPTGAMQLQHRPVLRHLRSRTGPVTSDDERRSTLL
jgi:hypothetical protein